MTHPANTGMVERVARAVIDYGITSMGSAAITDEEWAMLLADPKQGPITLGMAKAAIEAMRDPTENVEDAARGLWLWYGGGKQSGWTIGRHNKAAGYGLSLTPDEAVLDHLPKHVCGRIAWRTMIDAALSGRKER